jgi:hypothetical protein
LFVFFSELYFPPFFPNFLVWRTATFVRSIRTQFCQQFIKRYDLIEQNDHAVVNTTSDIKTERTDHNRKSIRKMKTLHKGQL